MIVPMKKIAIIMQQKDAGSSITALRACGVVHVEHQQLPKGKDISLLQEDVALVKQALGVISEEETALKYKAKEEKIILVDWKQAAKHIIELWKRLDHLEEYSRALTRQINDWQAWGDFDPHAIGALAENNVYVRLYRIPQKELHRLPQDVIVEKISAKGGIVYCAVVSREKIDIGFKELELPKFSLASMQKRLLEDDKITQEFRLHLNKHLSYRYPLEERKEYLEKELEFYEAVNGMAQAETLVYLVGYAPAENEEQLMGLAEKEKWGIFIAEPSAEDNIPTLIRNPKWVSIISPLFKLLEVLPGYHELDASLFFLIFFSMFFGMIIGDAGYGLIYLLLTIFAHRKFGKKMRDKSAFFLFYSLGFCAIIWGLLTGTFFGQEWYIKSGFKAFMPVLNNTKFLQAFCFFIGALHLSLAHSWKAALKAPSLTALAEIGWICLLWAGFFLAKTLILGDIFPAHSRWLIIAGIALVVFCTDPQKNILKTVGSGLATVALNLMNNFTDVVSYIRLFAVGLAGVAIADTVNTLAAGLGSGNFLAKALIVFIGHTINFILGPMSVLVHGVRLNVLEFSGHAGLTWSGIRYKPLSE